MDTSINIKDKVKLNFEIDEFNISKYFDGNQSYSFKNIQLNIIKPENDLTFVANDFLPCNAPIILSNFEEQILKINIENNRKIAYTKSFRIDLLKAIEDNEIKINNPINYEQKENQIFKNFVENLISHNLNYACGLITKSERKNHLIGSFQDFFRTIFKNELEQIKVDESQLTDKEFFSKRWKSLSPEKDYKKKVNNIIFIWSPPNFGWMSQFISEGINRGIDKKTYIKLTFSGIYISKEKSGKNKSQVFLNISKSEKQIDKLSFDVKLWEKNILTKRLETKSLWNNLKFKEMLEIVIESPTC